MRGSASYSLPPIVADPPKARRWRTVADFDGRDFGPEYLRFSGREFIMFVRHPEEDNLWAFGRLLERAASPELGWFPRNYVEPVDEITHREGSEPPHSGTLSDPSTRVSPGLQDRGESSAPAREGAEPGSDEVRGVNHNLEEEVAKECYIQTRVSGYPTETDEPQY